MMVMAGWNTSHVDPILVYNTAKKIMILGNNHHVLTVQSVPQCLLNLPDGEAASVAFTN